MGVAVQSGLKIEFRVYAANVDSSITRSLGEQEAHIWHAPLRPSSLDVSRLQPLLSEDESKRAGRFRFEKNRNEFILGRGWLRILSASYLGVSPAELGFAYSSHGKPYLSAPASAQALAFNVSHTEGMVLFAFTWSRKVGIDVENVRGDFNAPEIAERFFSVAEREALRRVPAEQQYEAFFRCWTRKEAYVKAQGEGLSHPLHEFDVSLAPDETSALLATRPDPAEADRWLLRDLPVTSGYAAAFAVEVDSTPFVPS
jgi:4'-phosphopantetheinyl transferase